MIASSVNNQEVVTSLVSSQEVITSWHALPQDVITSCPASERAAVWREMLRHAAALLTGRKNFLKK